MRSHYCGALRARDISVDGSQQITLSGWVHCRRDHGGVIFLDLRDREGIVQVVFDPDREQSFALADACRNEFVVQVSGTVRARPAGTENADMPTGEVEVLGQELVGLFYHQDLIILFLID